MGSKEAPWGINDRHSKPWGSGAYWIDTRLNTKMTIRKRIGYSFAIRPDFRIRESTFEIPLMFRCMLLDRLDEVARAQRLFGSTLDMFRPILSRTRMKNTFNQPLPCILPASETPKSTDEDLFNLRAD